MIFLLLDLSSAINCLTIFIFPETVPRESLLI